MKESLTVYMKKNFIISFGLYNKSRELLFTRPNVEVATLLEREGDYSSVELAWCAYTTRDAYRTNTHD